nr:hypothetical protein [Bacteroides gallinarum]
MTRIVFSLFVCLVGCFTAFAQNSLSENCGVTIELLEESFLYNRLVGVRFVYGLPRQRLLRRRN